MGARNLRKTLGITCRIFVSPDRGAELRWKRSGQSASVIYYNVRCSPCKWLTIVATKAARHSVAGRRTNKRTKRNTVFTRVVSRTHGRRHRLSLPFLDAVRGRYTCYGNSYDADHVFTLNQALITINDAHILAKIQCVKSVNFARRFNGRTTEPI